MIGHIKTCIPNWWAAIKWGRGLLSSVCTGDGECRGGDPICTLLYFMDSGLYPIMGDPPHPPRKLSSFQHPGNWNSDRLRYPNFWVLGHFQRAHWVSYKVFLNRSPDKLVFVKTGNITKFGSTITQEIGTAGGTEILIFGFLAIFRGLVQASDTIFRKINPTGVHKTGNITKFGQTST